MIVNENTVEAVFLTELCTMDDIPKGFVGHLKDPASELDWTLHTSATRGVRFSKVISKRDLVVVSHLIFPRKGGYPAIRAEEATLAGLFYW